MNLLIRQIWALVRKNLLIICLRRPISTFIRALAIPLVVVLVLSYTKEFFASPNKYGISSPHTIRSLEEGLAASDGRDVVGFVTNGMQGDVSELIDSLSKTIKNAGKSSKQYRSMEELTQSCVPTGADDGPKCYGAVVFLSSPEQGTNISSKGTWNYTIRGDLTGGFSDVTQDRNSAEVYLMPLQRAVDAEIVARSRPNSEVSFPKTRTVVYTGQNQQSLDDSRTSNFLALCIYAFGTLYTFTLVGIVYHMTSFVSHERELGMSGLIDTMIPGGSNIRGRLARQIATYISFAIVYFPSWLAVGVVVSKLAFPKTSNNIPVGFTIFAGLALTSFSLFGASFFKRSQLSGSILIVIALVFAILPQTLYQQTKVSCGIMSFLFPSATYTYFITGAATFEANDIKIQMWSSPSGESTGPGEINWRLNIGIHWLFLAIQIVVYPCLAFFVEHVRFSTASPYRTFVLPPHENAPTVTLTSFSKTYKAGIFSRIFKRRKDVHAVVNMSMSAYRGQILCLLGPNGSGKSTTMNCIAAQHKVTSGSVAIDPSGGMGYAPQNNVIWPDLTVEEHIRIFSDLKCISNVNEEVVSELVRMCDLQKKLPSKAKTLSGGQKRKLQLAMMFAGGSAVCCVDEVSTGLDPISRRRIWEILLAERHRRTIIMTTHFLDEADYLSDNIVIMYKGTLKAEGTAAALKNQYGRGFTIKLPENIDVDVPLSEAIEKETSRHQVVFRVATAALVTDLVDHLEAKGIHDYQISGPTMEELFLKATGENISSTESTEKDKHANKTDENDDVALVKAATGQYELKDGRPISVIRQWYLLVSKRFRILRRRYIPYFVAVAFAIVGAGVSPLLIKSFQEPMSCPQPADLINDYQATYRYDLVSIGGSKRILFGPPDKLNETSLAQVASVYSHNNTRSIGCDPAVERYCSDYGYHNTTQLKDSLVMVNTYDEFIKKIQNYQAFQSGSSYGSGVSYEDATMDGGLWVGDDETTFATNVQSYSEVSIMLNFVDNIVTGVPISAGYASFPTEEVPDIFDSRPLIFIVYYGLIMAVYPAFFALYPTNERISNVRSMQYSNGIRPLPLWLSHLAFDSIFVLLISSVATGLLSASTPVWVGLGYIWVILFLYGLTATLLSYIISMFARSAVTAWFMIALGQVIFYFAYLGGLIGVQSSYPYMKMEGVFNSLFFGLGIVSPVVCLERALTIGLTQFAALCNGHSAGSIYLFGGPILYLILQGLVLFTILLWWDSSFKLPSIGRRGAVHDSEETEMYSRDLMNERKRLNSANCDLRVESVSKTFGKNNAVDNVTFGVQSSEIFALLGPNGAGKSTIISMIRGDLKPSTSDSAINIAGYSILSAAVAARANLGVCPQFDSADVLTVNETLRFFARIRGVSNIDHNVSTVIAACGLGAWENQLAQKLSGGTKRKLSLAVALVGNPRVLVLDEPSSALDANAKRNMWRCLQSTGQGRAVVLTTHSMEEADALADRIGIVSSRMLALGEREDLKRRAGDSFHIHLVARSAPRTTDQELRRMKDWIVGSFANANISRETQGGQIRFEVPAEGRNLGELIQMLEKAKDNLGVEFYTVGKATLDEVFENIVKRHGEYTEK